MFSKTSFVRILYEHKSGVNEEDEIPLLLTKLFVYRLAMLRPNEPQRLNFKSSKLEINSTYFVKLRLYISVKIASIC